MDPSYLKDLLWRGREVEFDYGMTRYVVKRVEYYTKSEYTFGRTWGNDRISSDYFDGILHRHDYGASLSEMLREVSSSNIYIH